MLEKSAKAFHAEAGTQGVPATGWRIVFATDGSDCARQAGQLLARIAFPQGTRIRIVAVAANPFLTAGIYGDPGFAYWQVNQELLEAEQALLKDATHGAAQRLSGHGWVVTESVLLGDVCHQILSAVQQEGANLVLVGTKGRAGLDRILLGSTARSVARYAPCSVLIARAMRGELSRVVLAIDESEQARKAIETLIRFPLPARAEVVVTHVLRPYHPLVERLELLPGGRAHFAAKIDAVRQHQQQVAQGLLAAACERLAGAGRNARPELRTGDPAEEILNLAREMNANLLVSGARGVSLVPGLVLGSVADSLLQNAPCSLLLVR